MRASCAIERTRPAHVFQFFAQRSKRQGAHTGAPGLKGMRGALEPGGVAGRRGLPHGGQQPWRRVQVSVHQFLQEVDVPAQAIQQRGKGSSGSMISAFRHVIPSSISARSLASAPRLWIAGRQRLSAWTSSSTRIGLLT